jgi:hypothetical protein
MAKKPETLTCLQLWRRYHNADEASDKLHYKWKHTVNELHNTEYRIGMVKESLRKEYEKLPAKGLKKAIPLEVQEKLFFLRNELAALYDLRKEIHAIIAMYKKAYEETITRANRYKMAYHRIKVIAAGRIPEGTEKRGKFIDEFTCSVQTEKNGRLNIKVEIDYIVGLGGTIEFHY